MFNLYEEQVKIEAKMRDLGIEKFRQSYRKWCDQNRVSEVKSVRTVLNAAIEPFAKAISDFLSVTKVKKVGRKYSSANKLSQFSPETLAYITLKVTLDGFMDDRELPKLAIRIGSYLETEARFHKFAEQRERTARIALRNLNRESLDGAYRNSALNRLMKDQQTEEESEQQPRWTQAEKCILGIKLIELLCISTGFLTVGQVWRRQKTYRVVRATERLKAWILSLNTRCELMYPHYLPCVIPPKDWTSLQGGGYHTDALAYPLSLVRTRSRAHKARLKKADLSLTYRVVNALQSTSWRVNAAVLDVALALYEQGSGLAGLPSEDLALPPKPHDIDTNEEARKAWRQQAARIYDYNSVLTSRRILVLKTLTTAREFAEYEAIYFPYHLDFRGRVYSVVTGLSPQGTDLAKGLLTFAKSEAITTEVAWNWLAIHGANCFGLDKVSFAERLEFVDNNFGRIMATAKAPLDNLWWTEADSPFAFLAWCFEWARGLDAKATGESFYSSLPVAMDGSCNGLQHYAAMLADPVAGEATNLTPSKSPQDIYEHVAERVRERLKVITETGDDEDKALAQTWLDFGIDRKITKRPVMILPYGGTLSACQSYVYDVVSEREGGATCVNELNKKTQWLAKHIWQAIDDVVVSAKLAMSWLRKVAGVISKANHELGWTAPTGFPVYQYYPKLDLHRVETALFGTSYRPRIHLEQPAVLDKARHVNGIAPNFVHALDAAALFFTVDEALKEGLHAFAMVHDSFGTHAAHAEQLAKLLRQAFIKLYEQQNILTAFKHEAVAEKLTNEVPEPPFIGGLNLRSIAQSPYFFA